MKGRKSTWKVMLIAIFALTMTLAVGSLAYAQEGKPVNVFLDGNLTDFVVTTSDSPAFIDNTGHTLVPARYFAEKLGAYVTYDSKLKTATFRKNGKTIVWPVDSREVMVNGTLRQTKAPSWFDGFRIFVPVRFLAEELGFKVLWDGDIHVNSPGYINTPAHDHTLSGIPVRTPTVEDCLPEQIRSVLDGDTLIYIDTSVLWLWYINQAEQVYKKYQIAVGKKKYVNGEWITRSPIGTFWIANKDPNPYHPQKAFGKRWMGIMVNGIGNNFGIHGNNNEDSIGTYASAGCIRLHNWDAEELYDYVMVGDRVIIVR